MGYQVICEAIREIRGANEICALNVREDINASIQGVHHDISCEIQDIRGTVDAFSKASQDYLESLAQQSVKANDVGELRVSLAFPQSFNHV